MGKIRSRAVLSLAGLAVAVVGFGWSFAAVAQGPDQQPAIEEPVFVTQQKDEKDKGEQKKDEPKTPPAGQQQPDPPTPTTPTPEPTRGEPGRGESGRGEPGRGESPGGSVSNTGPGQQTVTPPALTASGDTGSVLANSVGASGVDVQRRAPLAVDPRIRGYHVGQVLSIADWAFWTPARIDLDTALGAIDPENIANITIIKGPYSVRYGPGFAFLDVDTLTTPRTKEDCFEAHGSTSVLYRTNNDGWTGRQYIWGGGKDWGFRLGYNLLAGDDYFIGNGRDLPSSYNSQNVDFAIGFDLTDNTHLEIKYLRQMQHDVEYPGLLTDINQQNTDGLSARYIWESTGWFDRLAVDGWYNNTSFTGDSSHPGKRRQIPQLDAILIPNSPTAPMENQVYFNAGGKQIRLDLETDARLSSWGFREAMTWGQDKGVQLTAGADINVIGQQYNEFDSFDFSIPVNFGIPRSQSIDPGIFVDGALPIGECLMLRAGMRLDSVSTDLLHLGPNVPNDPNGPLPTYSAVIGPDAFNTQHFFLMSAFGTAEYKLNDQVTMSAGYGFAQRPPLLTELYTGGAFFGLIQNGFNSIYGNPNLSPEQVNQIDIGIKGNYECARAGAYGFFALVNDYVTYQPNPFGGSGQFTIQATTSSSGFLPNQPGKVTQLATVLREYRYINTAVATLSGFELFGEYDVLNWLTPFATAGYVQGYDDSHGEPLPGISPLEGRFGVRVHDPEKNPRWSVEFLARAVAPQDMVATSLGEQTTPGFMVFNIRGFLQVNENVLLTAAVENLADRTYQEHLDLRTGLGVFQPGINFTFGVRVSY